MCVKYFSNELLRINTVLELNLSMILYRYFFRQNCFSDNGLKLSGTLYSLTKEYQAEKIQSLKNNIADCPLSS